MVYDLNMNIADSKEAKTIDNDISSKYEISPLIRMEIAGLKSSEIIKENFELSNALIIIGNGNNGGDAAVVARHLQISGIKVDIFLANNHKSNSAELDINLRILRKIKTNFIKKISNSVLQNYDLIVDGIFGIGLNRKIKPNSNIFKIIKILNNSKRQICSLDIPSGQCATSGMELGICVKSDLTITYDIAKVGLINDPGYEKSKKIHILNLGTPKEIFLKTNHHYVDGDFFSTNLLNRKKSSNKGSHGHLLVIGGSKNMPGAVTIAGLSAYRSGCGLVSICVPECISSVLKKSVPEAIIIDMPNKKDGKTFDDNNFIANLNNKLTKKPTSIVIGPGMGNSKKFKKLIFELVKNYDCKFIIDADALNSLGEDIQLLKKLKKNIIITPHPGEMSRLMNSKISEIQNNRVEVARSFSKKNHVVTVLKGFRTTTSSIKGEIYINGSGNEGMATGGMGDSLSGIIGSLAAQNYTTINSAILGVYAHGKAGDILWSKKYNRGILARDIIKHIPECFWSSNKNTRNQDKKIIVNE